MKYYYTCPNCFRFGETRRAEFSTVFRIWNDCSKEDDHCPECGYEITDEVLRKYGMSFDYSPSYDFFRAFAELGTYLMARSLHDPVCLYLYLSFQGFKCPNLYIDAYETNKSSFLIETFGNDSLEIIGSNDIYTYMSDMFYKEHIASLPLDPHITELINNIENESYREPIRLCLYYLMDIQDGYDVSKIEDYFVDSNSFQFAYLRNSVSSLLYIYDNKPEKIEDLDKNFRLKIDKRSILTIEKMVSGQLNKKGESIIRKDTQEYADFVHYLADNIDNPLVMIVIQCLKDNFICGHLIEKMSDLTAAMISVNALNRFCKLFGKDDAVAIREDKNRMKLAVESYMRYVVSLQNIQYREVKNQIISLISKLDCYEVYCSILSYFGVLYEHSPNPFDEMARVAIERHSDYLHLVMVRALDLGGWEFQIKIRGYWDLLFRSALRSILYGSELGYRPLNRYLNRMKQRKIAGIYEFISIIVSFGLVEGATGSEIIGSIADCTANSSSYHVLNKAYQKVASVTRNNRKILMKYRKYPEANCVR